MGNFASKNTQLDVTSGAAHVRTLEGTGALSKDKELNDVNTVESVTWTAGENITSITVTAFPVASGVSQNGDGAALTFNPVNSTVRDLNLLEGSGMRKVVLIGHPRTFDIIGGGVFTQVSAIKLADSLLVHLLIEAN